MSKKQANSIVLLWSLSKIVPTSKKYAHMRMPNSQPMHSCVWRTVSWENNCLGNTPISKYHFSLKSWQINVRDSMKNNKYNQLGEIFWKLVIVWSHIRKKLNLNGGVLLTEFLTTANILSNDIEQKTKITITVKRTIEKVSFYK